MTLERRSPRPDVPNRPLVASLDHLGLSSPFGGDRREWGAKKALLLGGFEHRSRLSEVVRMLRRGASGGADEVAQPRAARQAAAAVGHCARESRRLQELRPLDPGFGSAIWHPSPARGRHSLYGSRLGVVRIHPQMTRSPLYLKRHRDTYYDHLQQVPTFGTWEEWLRFFLEGVVDVAGKAQPRTRQDG
jgi:hypothetical protein